jgi:hypothetical protein
MSYGDTPRSAHRMFTQLPDKDALLKLDGAVECFVNPIIQHGLVCSVFEEQRHRIGWPIHCPICVPVDTGDNH